MIFFFPTSYLLALGRAEVSSDVLGLDLVSVEYHLFLLGIGTFIVWRFSKRVALHWRTRSYRKMRSATRCSAYFMLFKLLNNLDGFRSVSVIKNLPASAGDMGSIPELWRSPGKGGNGNLLQHSCLGNSMDRGAWRATVRGFLRSWTKLSDWAYTYTAQQS